MPPHELGHDYISKWVVPWDEHFDPFRPCGTAPAETPEPEEKAQVVYQRKQTWVLNRLTPFNSSTSEDTPN